MIRRLAAAARVTAWALRDLRKGRRPHLRSSHWGAVRRAHLEEHPTCAACAAWDKLEVHHIMPFHEHPELELVPANLITLCDGPAKCHFRLGHFGDWKKSNPEVRRDAARRLAHGYVMDIAV